LRKAIKIKASVLLFAWSLIFLHGIIPHTHHDPGETGCSSICHHGSQEGSNSETFSHSNLLLKNIEVGHEHNGIICHFASELIHQNDIDKVFINETGNIKLDPLTEGRQCIISTDPGRIIRVSFSLMPLRAPPVA